METELASDNEITPAKKSKPNEEITSNECSESCITNEVQSVDSTPPQPVVEVQPTLSKKQMKKLKKLAEWEVKKKEKRLKEREKYKLKKLEAIEKGEPRTGPSRKELKRNKSSQSKNFLQVVIDLDYDDLMIDKDISKCVKQLLRIYTINRRSKAPAKLHFTGIKDNGRIHKCLAKNDGYENWDVEWAFGKTYNEVLPKENLIYLTSDSDNILEKLDENMVYVIGGLVDHNHQKGICFDRAQKLELKTARLPLIEHVDMETRTVLSTVHVFEMLLRVSENKNWSDTILDILPMRKGAKPKVEKINDKTATDESEINSTPVS